MLTPAAFEAGFVEATRNPTSTVLKVATYGGSFVPSVSTAGSPIRTVYVTP